MNKNNFSIFTQENINTYLKELAKEFRKLNGKTMPAELILIGGASMLINYGFRQATTDIDAIMHASSAMKETVNRVSDKYNLPNGWLNSDFTKTASYSPRLNEISTYYKTFSNILTIRTVAAEYLIAMKLCSGREYKNDRSDVVGILAHHKRNGSPINFEQVDNAVKILYGGWNSISQELKDFIKNVVNRNDLDKLYEMITEQEYTTKQSLISFRASHPGLVTSKNIKEILEMLQTQKKYNEYDFNESHDNSCITDERD